MAMLMPCVFMSVLLAAELTLPAGYEKSKWGITAGQLVKQVPAVKIEAGAKYHFAEHMEIDPDVYVLTGQDGKRIEYYFYKGRLYKVFVVYDKVANASAFYNQLKKTLIKKYGLPQREYAQKVFGITVNHALWEDPGSIFDLREGAGFIYEVRVQKSALKEKQKAYDIKKAI